MTSLSPNSSEFALYHPWPPLDGRTLGGWVKTMLLFFDGVTILAPPDKGHQLVTREEETLAPLVDRGMFRVLDPADLIQHQEAEAILEFIFTMAARLEDNHRRWRRSRRSPLTEAARRGGLVYVSRSLRGYDADETVRDTASMLWDALRQHGVATAPDGEGTIRMHPTFWSVYQAFLAHSVYEAGLRAGLVLRPATDSAQQIHAQNAMLDVPGHPSAGHVVGFDLQQVTIDLSKVELSEVLQFRHDHGAAYRRYSADLRAFAMAASQAAGEERAALLRDRHDALADAAADLRRTSRDWRRRAAASVGLGLSGAAWSGSAGDWPAAILAVLGGVLGTGGRPKVDNAFSYLFDVERSFAR